MLPLGAVVSSVSLASLAFIGIGLRSWLSPVGMAASTLAGGLGDHHT
jgi:hypothetical protein